MSTSLNDVVFEIYRELEHIHKQDLHNMEEWHNNTLLRTKLKRALNHPSLVVRKLHSLLFPKTPNEYEKRFIKWSRIWSEKSLMPNVFTPAGKTFPDTKIAVYTCITGGYDEIKEPFYVDDSIDYYAVTDSVKHTGRGGGMDIYSSTGRTSGAVQREETALCKTPS